MLWDPDRTPDTAGFMEAYYGAGAPFVRKYLDYIHEKVKDLHFNLVISAANLWNPLIPDGDIPMLDALWADAYTAALNGGTTANGFGIPAELAARHVERSALCHRWFKLDGKRGEFADESASPGLMNAFYADCKRLEVTKLNEGADVPWVEVE